MKNTLKKTIHFILAAVAVSMLVFALLPVMEASAAGRLKCDSEKEIWINRAVEIPVTLQDRQKTEDISVSVSKPSYVKAVKGKWKGDVCRLKLTPKKSGTVTVTISSGSEKIRVKLHLSKRKLLSATEIYSKIESAMVSIETRDSKGNVYIGSGFFISRDLILTNHHVLDSAKSVAIKDYSGNTYQVKAIEGYSLEEDLLLIRVKSTKKAVNSALILAKELPKTGDQVYGCGSPYGIAATFSEGIVSQAERELDGKKYIQNTVPTSTGSGGGPIINCYGEVVGINTLTVPAGQNMNFAVPVSRLTAAGQSETWKPISPSAFFKTTSDEKKESNDMSFGDSFVQLTNRKQANSVAGLDYLAPYQDKAVLKPAEIYTASLDSMAHISAYDRDGNVGGGTCFFINDDTMITNYHIVDLAYIQAASRFDYDNIFVWDNYDQIYKVNKILFDAENDVAVLKIDRKPSSIIDGEKILILTYDEADENGETAKTVSAGADSDSGQNGDEYQSYEIKKHGCLQLDFDYIPFVGEKVYAIGNPLSYDMTFSSGIVSTSRRQVYSTDCIQMTTPITSGSSGGVLLNGYGNVIGITSMSKVEGQNLNWAVMSKYIRPLLD